MRLGHAWTTGWLLSSGYSASRVANVVFGGSMSGSVSTAACAARTFSIAARRSSAAACISIIITLYMIILLFTLFNNNYISLSVLAAWVFGRISTKQVSLFDF